METSGLCSFFISLAFSLTWFFIMFLEGKEILCLLNFNLDGICTLQFAMLEKAGNLVSESLNK